MECPVCSNPDSLILTGTLSERLRYLRRINLITLKQVTNKISIKSTGQLSDFETGRCAPNVKNIRALAKLYGVSLDELFEGL